MVHVLETHEPPPRDVVLRLAIVVASACACRAEGEIPGAAQEVPRGIDCAPGVRELYPLGYAGMVRCHTPKWRPTEEQLPPLHQDAGRDEDRNDPRTR